MAPDVEVIDTHLSWVCRRGDEVWKRKKPVLFAGHDLRTLAARRENCEAEVRLNRRFAPSVYLGVAALCRRPDGAIGLGPPGPVVDWVVRMKRLPDDAFLDRRVAAGDVDLDRLRLALEPVFRHLSSSPPGETDPERYLASLRHDVDAAVAAVAASGVDGRVAPVARRLREWTTELADVLRERVRRGWVVEGHGDLRPEHVCLADEPVVIDCLEFDVRLRTLDGLDDVGFLALECELLGAPDVAAAVVAQWREASGDDAPAELLALYQAIRALKRSSVAAHRVTTCDALARPVLQRRIRRYVAAAEALLD